ncbi:MAG: DUF502 domain-containing protein [Candidatus Cloacimonetes bacterium]|nr:DUF502 domain-containing protein [Candidatus Cloacimonadota bacterium]
MNKVIQHLKKYILAGILAIIPLFLVLIIVRFFYLFIDQNVLDLIDDYIGIRIPGLGLLLTVLLLYFVGLLSRNLFGKWLLNIFERITQKIPIIGTTYQVGKQISNTLSLPEKQVFKKVVLIHYLNDELYTVGFITGSLIEKKSQKILYKIFVPTPPNPTTGTIIIAKETDFIEPGWTIDEGIRTVISAGIIGPKDINLQL